jgi:hypothetical protein
MQFIEKKISPNHLLLDPNNYRFLDIPSYKQVNNRARYGESSVQSKALNILRMTESFELKALKSSISANGFVPLEQIVVEAFDTDPTTNQTRYLVIEGNRRTASVKILIEENEAGQVDLSDAIIESIKELPVIILDGSEEERKKYQQTLMAIRHVSGIKAWGSYQQAKLVVQMFDEEYQSFAIVAEKIGISSKEVARRYRASKALQQMEDDDEFGQYAEPRMYSFFHEAVSQPKVRDWLGFSDETFQAKNDGSKRAFYELLSPRSEEGSQISAKLTNANKEVRQLKNIVDKPHALQILLDPEKTFEDAVIAAQKEAEELQTSPPINYYLNSALESIRAPGIDAWTTLNPEAERTWSEFVKLVNSIDKLIRK